MFKKLPLNVFDKQVIHVKIKERTIALGTADRGPRKQELLRNILVAGYSEV